MVGNPLIRLQFVQLKLVFLLNRSQATLEPVEQWGSSEILIHILSIVMGEGWSRGLLIILYGL
jgi:hypothetical protein